MLLIRFVIFVEKTMTFLDSNTQLLTIEQQNALLDDVIEDASARIDCATADQIAGLLSGHHFMFLTREHETHILPAEAEYDGVFRQVYGPIYDLAVNDTDALGDDYEILAAAIKIVGMPEGYEDLEDIEEDGIGDKIRASALNASPEFDRRHRTYLKRRIDRDYLATVLEQIRDGQEHDLDT